MDNHITQRERQRRALEEELRHLEEQKAAVEKQLVLLRSGFKDPNVTVNASQNKRKLPAAAKPSSKNPSRVVLPDHDSLWAACQKVLQDVRNHNREMVQWFVNPVDRKVVPDYYNIIKNPISVSEVEKKTREKKYCSPLDFRDDMRLMWDNCRIYNRIGTVPRLAGDTLSEVFEKRWATSGIEEALAVKEAQEFIAEMNAKMPEERERLLSDLGDLDRRIRDAQVKIDRYFDDHTGDVSFEDKRKLSLALGNLSGDNLARAMDAVVDGMRRQGRAIPAEGEVEVDLDELDRETLVRLQQLCVEFERKPRRGHAPSKTAAQPGGGGGGVAHGGGMSHPGYGGGYGGAAHAQQQPAPSPAPAPAPAGVGASEQMGQKAPMPPQAQDQYGYGGGPQSQGGTPYGQVQGYDTAGMLGAASGDARNGGRASEGNMSGDESSSDGDSEDESEGKGGGLAGYGGHAPITQVSGNVRGAQPQIVKSTPARREPQVNPQSWQQDLGGGGGGGDPFAEFQPRQDQ